MLTIESLMDASNEFPKARIDVLKKSMTLNFNGGANGGLLDSPDLKMVQMASPDLENLLFQNGLLTLQTPTPGALMRMLSMREDEKPDLRGFEEALAKLHSQRTETLQQFSEAECALGQPIATESQPMQQVELVYSGAPSKRPFNETIIDHQCSGGASKRAAVTHASSAVSNEDDSPCSSASGSIWSEDESYSQRSVPRGAMRSAVDSRRGKTRAAAHGSSKHLGGSVEPVDLQIQERLRVERKRERNRVAARKCRERKIRKIDELTAQVQKLEGDKKNLAVRLNRLQTEISRLRSVIQEHAHSGCKVPLGTR